MSSPIPRALRRVIEDEFGDDPATVALIERFLQLRRDYHPGFAEELLAAAGTPGLVDDRGWARRCLAALMLQHQVLLLPPGDFSEYAALLERLGLWTSNGPEAGVRMPALREGYTSRDPEAFLVQFRRRLGRWRRIFSPLRRCDVSPQALRDFLVCSRQECKLVLARYLFPVADIVLRIHQQVRRSDGLPAAPRAAGVLAEARRALDDLPDQEARLLEELVRDGQVYWVADHTPSRLNALVEYPLTTIVMVVKPPGSGLEIELKRVGRRRDRPLDIVFAREGRPVPISHRLDGGSMERSLQWEARQVARLAAIYRSLHGFDPPVSRTISLTYIETVPTNLQNYVHIIEYFSLLCDSTGGESSGTREQLNRVITAYSRGRFEDGPEPAGDEALILQFIEHTSPTQAILVGTSSFRLSMLHRYLAPDGFRHYLEQQTVPMRTGTGRMERVERATEFADTLLEEVLGIYQPPVRRSRQYSHYVAAALAARTNRSRADRNHVALAGQLGTFWGTLLAVRAFTNGESFVARNVGIRSTWQDGFWRVHLVFMDHDDVHFADEASETFEPQRVLPGMIRDETHAVYDSRGRPRPVTILDHLAVIYRSDQATCRLAEAALRRSMSRAYRLVQDRWKADPSLGGLVSPIFGQSSRAWDRVVAAYLAHRRRGTNSAAWRRDALRALNRARIECPNPEQYLEPVERFTPFLERYAFLYRAQRPGPGHYRNR
jgi:hypothetical protein